ncbi:MAG: hypothetical protein JSS61_00765 [Verrucomicrobia bacterium]|nr:hypothetical protein [Verrucomicrobiota bacterium]
MTTAISREQAKAYFEGEQKPFFEIDGQKYTLRQARDGGVDCTEVLEAAQQKIAELVGNLNGNTRLYNPDFKLVTGAIKFVQSRIAEVSDDQEFGEVYNFGRDHQRALKDTLQNEQVQFLATSGWNDFHEGTTHELIEQRITGVRNVFVCSLGLPYSEVEAIVGKAQNVPFAQFSAHEVAVLSTFSPTLGGFLAKWASGNENGNYQGMLAELSLQGWTEPQNSHRLPTDMDHKTRLANLLGQEHTEANLQDISQAFHAIRSPLEKLRAFQLIQTSNLESSIVSGYIQMLDEDVQAKLRTAFFAANGKSDRIDGKSVGLGFGHIISRDYTQGTVAQAGVESVINALAAQPPVEPELHFLNEFAAELSALDFADRHFALARFPESCRNIFTAPGFAKITQESIAKTPPKMTISFPANGADATYELFGNFDGASWEKGQPVAAQEGAGLTATIYAPEGYGTAFEAKIRRGDGAWQTGENMQIQFVDGQNINLSEIAFV